MSFKVLCIDLDGTMVDLKKVHKDCFNQAISEIAGPEFTIREDEHLKIFDGKKSHEKLSLLNSLKAMPPDFNREIWRRKQELTQLSLDNLEKDERLIEVFRELKEMGLRLACCSNSIRITIETALDRLGISEYFDLIVSNEDCISPKSHPEIFWLAMILFKALPEETLIIEDSPVGLMAAYRSGARVMRVKSPKELTMENIKEKLNMTEDKKPKWVDKDLNVLILASGKGSRFEEQGFSMPKPLVSVEGEPMIKVVIDSLNIDANYIFVIRKEHNEKYNMGSMLNLICPGCRIIEVDKVTDGAACSALLAKEFINNNQKLIIANADQKPIFDSSEWLYSVQEQNLDGSVLTFENFSPKWSYVKNDKNGFVSEIAEKVVISNRASVGVYFWKNGADFVWSAEKMISEEKKVLNEYYLFPSMTELIEKDHKIKEYPVEKMYGLGVPEDLREYLNRDKNND